ncbi:DUF4845 domain-containing protein [Coralloluteibacterium stylophorae]|uniref:DUF4845 domain-containing protein n=1 Tax=Coralloluteibacterium stylophorae TaxID=1776034 RepID=A0A8J7VV35_9GAMM|nr:DUF4845 domain-containing protein [Coralloluteibacterium stylophorae]MBS7458613.1 DUF4845 domain-containing protein [Coralloluteibacterium stylophorae]
MSRKERGLTLLGFLIVLVVVGFFAYVGMRLFPVYSEYYSVVSAMKGVANEPGAASMDPARIRDLLARRFDISYVDSVKPQNIKIVRSGNGYSLNIKYEVRRPLIYNLDFIASFDKTVDLVRGGQVD